MFRDTRKKRLRNRIIFSVMGAVVLSFGIWLNYQDVSKTEPAEDAVNKVEVKEEQTKNSSEESEDISGTDTETEPETYLIKEVDGVVKVYVCDSEGNQELYLITSIPFDLLSENDQQLFVDGVTIETEDDLGEFLQNFDS